LAREEWKKSTRNKPPSRIVLRQHFLLVEVKQKLRFCGCSEITLRFPTFSLPTRLGEGKKKSSGSFLNALPIPHRMKFPKTIMRYCPFCKKHVEHKINVVKRKAASSLTYGSKVRARRRGSARGVGNRGRYSKPAVTKFKMTGKKATKKTDFRYECKTCKKQHIQAQGFRSKKVEFK